MNKSKNFIVFNFTVFISLGIQVPVEVTKSVGETLATISNNKSALSKFDTEVELSMRNMTASEQTTPKAGNSEMLLKEDPISYSNSFTNMGRAEHRNSAPSPYFVDDDVTSNKDSAVESMYSDSATGNSFSDEYYKREIERNKEIYKFKSDMKSRFNQASHGSTEQEANVNWREECKKNREKTQSKVTSNSPELDYISAKSSVVSESPSENNSVSNGNDSGTCLSDGQYLSPSDRPPPSTQTHIPGFALHSSGTYYIPVIINTTSYTAVYQAGASPDRPPGILHPISIPVYFGGHIVPFKRQSYSNVSVSTNFGNSQSNSNSSVSSEGILKKQKT